MRAAYDNVARRQLGLLTTKQLTERGWTRKAIRYAIQDKKLYEIEARPGVLRTAGAPLSREQAWLAAAYAAGDDHYLSSLTATKVWRLEKFRDPDKIDLLTASTGRARLEGVRGRRTIWLPPSHVTTRGALPVTTPARTFADVCGELPIRLLRKSANDAMRRGILTPRDLALVVDEVPVSGRRKSKPLRLLVATFVPGYDPGDSDAELDVVEILVDGGYPRPDQQIEVKTEGFRYYIDVGYADSDDPERTSRLQRAGWTIWPVRSRTARAEILLTASVAFGHLRAA